MGTEYLVVVKWSRAATTGATMPRDDMMEGGSPAAMPSSTGGPRDRGAWRRRRPGKRVLLVVVPLVVVVAAALAGDPLAAATADRLGPRAVGGCAQLRGLSVSLGPWPVVLHAATGQLRHVAAKAEEVDIGNFRLRNFHARVDRVTFSSGLLTGHPGANVDGNGVMTVPSENLGPYLQGRGQRGSIAIPGVRVTAVRPVPHGLQISVSFRGHPSSLACSGRQAVK